MKSENGLQIFFKYFTFLIYEIFKKYPHAYKKQKIGTHYKCFCLSVDNREDGIYKCTFAMREDHLKMILQKAKFIFVYFKNKSMQNLLNHIFKKKMIRMRQ